MRVTLQHQLTLLGCVRQLLLLACCCGISSPETDRLLEEACEVTLATAPLGKGLGFRVRGSRLWSAFQGLALVLD